VTVLALDTDVLVHWAMDGAARHRDCRALVDGTLRRGDRIGLIPQVLFEFVHVVTDAARFERPLAMTDALALVSRLWAAPEVDAILPSRASVERACQLMRKFGLGRKRVLDSALACTLEAAGVRRLATLNAKDYAPFDFLEIVKP
jgi:predicted nucleic acid-binding protein